jgi:hypothetical protein
VAGGCCGPCIDTAIQHNERHCRNLVYYLYPSVYSLAWRLQKWRHKQLDYEPSQHGSEKAQQTNKQLRNHPLRHCGACARSRASCNGLVWYCNIYVGRLCTTRVATTCLCFFGLNIPKKAIARERIGHGNKKYAVWGEKLQTFLQRCNGSWPT